MGDRQPALSRWAKLFRFFKKWEVQHLQLWSSISFWWRRLLIRCSSFSISETSSPFAAAGSADDRRPMIRSLGDIQIGRSLGESLSLARGLVFTMASVDFTWVNIYSKFRHWKRKLLVAVSPFAYHAVNCISPLDALFARMVDRRGWGKKLTLRGV
jgi:hypothetical protein